MLLIDDFSRDDMVSSLGGRWEALSDRVMGGVSVPEVSRETVAGERAQRLRGSVRLDNNGGFIQMALSLSPAGSVLDATGYQGIAITHRGNGEEYGVHLRSTDVTRPWQSYRAAFTAGPAWREDRIPFSGFEPHRLTAPLDTARLTRIGIIAIGRAFDADLAVSRLAFY